jgi:hypothetical protein
MRSRGGCQPSGGSSQVAFAEATGRNLLIVEHWRDVEPIGLANIGGTASQREAAVPAGGYRRDSEYRGKAVDRGVLRCLKFSKAKMVSMPMKYRPRPNVRRRPELHELSGDGGDHQAAALDAAPFIINFA